MKLEIVTHCYKYPRLLRYHLSSIALYPPEDLDLKVTVCFTEEDLVTANVLRWFSGFSLPRVKWNWIPLSTPYLCRRSIGRNLVALASQADWIWFCDTDYWFRAGCWKALSAVKDVSSPLIFPRYVNLHKTRQMGDVRIASTTLAEELVEAPIEEFKPRKMGRAIGGIQIANGDVCRKIGYLNQRDRWQRPTTSPGFKKCVEDRRFRKSLGTSGLGINIPDVYRIRHTQAGRRNSSLCL